MNRLIGAVVLLAGMAFGDPGDPPSRVARLNYVSGSVSFQPAGMDNWSPASVNYPLTTGDQLWADTGSRVEMHIGSTSIQMDSSTASSFLNLDDRTVQIRLSQGSIYIRIRNLAEDEVYEVDTPNGAVSLLRPGTYRIDADPDREATTVTVRSGDAEISAAGSTFPVHASQSGILTGSDSPSKETRAAVRPDTFEGWCQERDGREDSQPAPRYVSREMPGYEDLDANGAWQDYPEYGHVWVPRVQVGWAPYRYGHWRWVEPWGWTWIDDASWGFAPFHYGRWAYGRNSWFWVPGPVVARPVYAPALVAFVGGDRWSASLSIGGGGGVAWFPLGPREVYRPAYRVSPTYVNRVNVVHVTNVTNVTNVNNVTYVNQRVPGAVTAVSRNDFTTARPVGRAAFNVPASAVASAPVAGFAPAVAPRQESVLARPAEGNVARPPASALNRTVRTRSTPPPPPVPFSARQNALAANPGQPVDPNTLNTLRQRNPNQRAQERPVAAPDVVGRQATPAYQAPPTPQVQNQPQPTPRSTNRERPAAGIGQQATPAYQTPPTPQVQNQPQPTPRVNNPERPSDAQREQLRQQRQQERTQQQQERVQRPVQPQAAPAVTPQRPVVQEQRREQPREERRATPEERQPRQSERREKEKPKQERQ